MGSEDRRGRERDARRRLIVTTARAVAEAEGWDAVTTRRLSTAVEYSQPVLYKHFAGMDQIVDAVAVDGFLELAEVVRLARTADGTAADALSRVSHAYLGYAADNPAVYDAMFSRATDLRFASEATPPQPRAAFAELRRAVEEVAGDPDAEVVTEVVWAALHGLVTLVRTGRLRPGHDAERVALLVRQLGAGHAPPA